MFFSRATGIQYVDRGDVLNADKIETDLALDGAWHDLDLSAIVPSNAKLILVRLYTKSDSASLSLRFRKKGYSTEYNFSKTYCRAANTGGHYDTHITCNASGIVEYKGDSGNWTSVEFTVGGWWI